MDTTVWMIDSEVEANYGNNSMDDRERGGSQLWIQWYGWHRESWKSVMETTVWMTESEVEISYGNNSIDGRKRGGSQLWNNSTEGGDRGGSQFWTQQYG